jgi:hypothetical protein
MMAELAGVGQYNTVDPEFTAVKQYNAQTLATAAKNAAPGQTAEEYLASRGGVNAAGYYGDSWNAKQNLSDTEYAAALAAARVAGISGVGLGDAINKASAKKAYDAALAAGVDPKKAKADYDAALAGTAGMLKSYGYTGKASGSSGKTVSNTTKNSDGSSTVTYSDGTTSIIPEGSTVPEVGSTTADLVATQNNAAVEASNKAERQSAFDVLYNEFNKYGLGSMVDAIKGLITDSNVNPSQFSLALQNTDAYKQRFSANQDRIKQGLRALTPAEYIGLEDQYQNVMRNYGLPASYYTKDSTGKQAGFDKFLAGDVSASELEDRIATAQQRVVNSNPEVLQALKQFYPDINNADILAYTLDPKNALDTIHRKVTAAEIGGAALAQGLQAQGGTAESLAGLGITKAQAQQGYTNVAEMVPRGSQLSDIYNQGPYNQQTAEAEVFNTAGAAAAAAKRKKLTALETAQFSGSSGVGSLNRDRAVSNYMLGQPGAGSY